MARALLIGSCFSTPCFSARSLTSRKPAPVPSQGARAHGQMAGQCTNPRSRHKRDRLHETRTQAMQPSVSLSAFHCPGHHGRGESTQVKCVIDAWLRCNVSLTHGCLSNQRRTRQLLHLAECELLLLRGVVRLRKIESLVCHSKRVRVLGAGDVLGNVVGPLLCQLELGQPIVGNRQNSKRYAHALGHNVNSFVLNAT